MHTRTLVSVVEDLLISFSLPDTMRRSLAPLSLIQSLKATQSDAFLKLVRSFVEVRVPFPNSMSSLSLKDKKLAESAISRKGRKFKVKKKRMSGMAHYAYALRSLMPEKLDLPPSLQECILFLISCLLFIYLLGSLMWKRAAHQRASRGKRRTARRPARTPLYALLLGTPTATHAV